MSKEAPFAEIANYVASAINFEACPFPVRWPHRYRIIEPAIGARLIVQETEDLEIQEVPLDHVAHRVVAWLRLQNDPELLMTLRKAREAVEMWLAFADPIPMAQIKSVRWKSEVGHTWRRLPWDATTGETPTWDKVFSKLTNPSAFRQWLGALFFEEASQHQYVWVHGMGNDGKGSINRFLKRVFGRAYRSKQPPHPGDKFWTHGLVGSRLVVFPDCNSQGFTAGGLFKSLSGGDPVDVEAKGKMSFTAELCCKFLFFSNEKPNLSCEDADMRRIIYCEFFEKTKKEDADAEFEPKLWAEGGAFLSRCVKEYRANCPDHQTIESDKGEIRAWVSVAEEKFEHVLGAYLDLPKNEAYQAGKNLGELTDAQLDLVTLEPKTLLAVLQSSFPDRRDQNAFRDWLYKKHGVQKKGIRRVRDGKDVVIYRYIGICKPVTRAGVEKLDKIERNLSTAVNGRWLNPVS